MDDPLCKINRSQVLIRMTVLNLQEFLENLIHRAEVSLKSRLNRRCFLRGFS